MPQFNDPINGYVNFVDGNTAQQDNLTSVDNGVVMIRADSTNIASGRGRNAVRLTSYKQYTHGLVVLDLQHMPGSACGVWPAFWMTGKITANNSPSPITNIHHLKVLAGPTTAKSTSSKASTTKHKTQ